MQFGWKFAIADSTGVQSSIQLNNNFPHYNTVKTHLAMGDFNGDGLADPVATDHDLQVIVFCSEGYTSSLPAPSQQDLGLWRATDMVGGFHAWRARICR